MTVGRVVVLASANPKKAAELIALLGDRLDVRPRPADLPDVVEDGETLEANATLKAMAVARATGGLALADDTGLFVDALDGRPGVRSARYAGEPADDDANVTLLLAELGERGARTASQRRARFRTVIALASPGGEVDLVDGICEGWISEERRGGTGFGYDPVFVPAEGDGRTFAEMGPQAKGGLSHRARALAAAVHLLAGDR
jgi:XTP/dITP diphosphohydrolase